MISVRPARPEDGPALAELRAEARAEASAKRGGPELLRSRPGDGAADSTVALVGLIGTAAVGHALARSENASLTIDELFVTPGARQVGVGSALLAALTDAAGELGCRAVSSVALPGDRDTKNFFESHALTARWIVVGSTLQP